jgi:hypothetical protein
MAHLYLYGYLSYYINNCLFYSLAELPAKAEIVDIHGQAHGTLTECKLRLTGEAGRFPLRCGTHSPTGKPVEPCGRLDVQKELDA